MQMAQAGGAYETNVVIGDQRQDLPLRQLESDVAFAGPPDT